MAALAGRDLHLVKKPFAFAALATERMPGPFQSGSDMSGMKTLFDRLIESDREFEHDATAARIVVTGEGR
jgi:hypothetical protein